MAYAGSPAGAVVSRGVGSGVTAATPPRAASIRTVRATAPIARRVTLYVVAHPDGRHAVIEPTQLGDYEGLGFSLKSVVKSVGKAVGGAAKAVAKGATAVGHTAGKVVTSGVGKGILAGGLALTGVGIPAAAAIMGGSQAVGALIKPGGNIGKAAKAGATGAAVGAGAAVVGKGIKRFAPSVTDASRRAFNKVTPGDTFKTDAKGAAINARRKTTVIPPVRPPGLPPGTPLKFKPVPDLITQGAPVLKAAEVATETPAMSGKDDKKKTPAKRTRISSLIDKAKKTAEAVQQTAQVAQVAPVEQSAPAPVVYNPGTGPLAQETPAPSQPGEEKPGLPLPLILGGAAVLLLVLNKK